MKNRFIHGSIGVGVGALGLFSSAVGIWLLDIVGLDVWVAHTFGDFISLVAERV